MKIFYYDAETENNFVGDEKIKNIDEVIEDFFYLSDIDGSFFGLISENKQVIQFSWEKDDIWSVDIPLKSTFESDDIRTSLQKYANYDECINIIENTYYNRSINNLYKVLIMKETLDEVKSRTTNISKYKLNIKGIENIKEEIVYHGWERGLFLYWSYKNNLLVPEVEKLIELYLNELESPTHEIFSEVLKNSIGDKFDLKFYMEESREFVLDYIYFSTEEYDFYIDIEKLYPEINNTTEISETEKEYTQIMKIFDSRYEEYQKIRE